MRVNGWALAALVGLGCGDGPDEWTCEVDVAGAAVCIDVREDKPCEDEWGGVAEAAEKEPGGPYVYCEDLGYTVLCPGRVVEHGENFTGNLSYYAATEEDCATADGGSLGG